MINMLTQKKYELNDPDFTEVPVKVYENFFEMRKYNNDGEAETSVSMQK